MLSFRQSVDQMVDRAPATMDLDPGTAAAIKSGNSVLQVRFPVRIKGQTEIFTGWRAVHSTHRLPTKGAGTRPASARTRSRRWPP